MENFEYGTWRGCIGNPLRLGPEPVAKRDLYAISLPVSINLFGSAKNLTGNVIL
jgi:hypothetical protein